MTDLADFLRARLDEDEALITSCGCECGDVQRPDCADRITAEIAAKRQLLDGHEPEDGPVSWDLNGEPRPGECAKCRSAEHPDHREAWPCLHVRLLALPYAGNPGYRKEWRP